MMWTGFKKQS